MNMEFLYKNYYNTSTSVSVTTGTGTVSRMYDNNVNTLYKSSGDNSDLTTTTITITFSSTQTVDRIILLDHNWKDFTAFYNGATASTFALTSTSATTVSDWSTNSSTSHYLAFSSTAITSVSFDITGTISANSEKEIGEIWLSEKRLRLTDNPTYEEYNPVRRKKRITHEMSDGGIATYIISTNFQADLNFRYLSSTVATTFRSIIDDNEDIIFVPFPTGTSFDGRAYHCVIDSDDTFDMLAGNNYSSLGYNGSINLREVAK